MVRIEFLRFVVVLRPRMVVHDHLHQGKLVLRQFIGRIETIEVYVICNLEGVELRGDILLILDALHISIYGVA